MERAVAKRYRSLAVALLRHLCTSSLTFLALVAAVQRLLAARRPGSLQKGRAALASNAQGAEPRHNVQRQAAIARGAPTDHAGIVVVVPDSAFDLNKTIFGSLRGALERYVKRSQLGVKLFWSDAAAGAIQVAFSKVPAPPPIEAPIVTFMKEECDFSMEHSDGSFMDHLNFCYDYSAAHFKAHSPRVLLLHSIMGVGTNCFPMEKSKIPKLKTLLTDFEYAQIQAFPSILRLLINQALLDDLTANLDRLDKLERVHFHRVLDNESLWLDAEAFWIQMNYHVIHLLDFLPTACWAAQASEPLFATFVDLFSLLRSAGKLVASVDCDLPSPGGGCTVEGMPLTLGSSMYRLVPSNITRQLARKAIRRYSAAIGHSLEYQLVWAP